jgi:beta-glucanase (GH16 family)
MSQPSSIAAPLCGFLATISLVLAGPASSGAVQPDARHVHSAHRQSAGGPHGTREAKKKSASARRSKKASSRRRRAKRRPRPLPTTSSGAGSAFPEPGRVEGALSKSSPQEAPATTELSANQSPTIARKLVWSDEFSGLAGASPGPQWSFDIGGGGWGNEELESYTSRPTNAELDGQGHLVITARTEKYTGTDGIVRDYTSARLQTLNTFRFEYGVAEARVRVPSGQGLVAQFWMLGQEAYEQDNWPGCGEIDIAEVLGSEPNTVNGTLHAPWPFAPTGVQGTATSAASLSAGFHTYSVEWEPERIRFMLDGSTYRTITPADLPAGAVWPFKHPYFLLLDLAVGGEWPGSPNASTHFPAQMLVDWVRVWQ